MISEELKAKAIAEIREVLAEESRGAIEFLLDRIEADLITDVYIDVREANGPTVCGCFYGTLWIFKHKSEISVENGLFGTGYWIRNDQEMIRQIEYMRRGELGWAELTTVEHLLLTRREETLELIKAEATRELESRTE